MDLAWPEMVARAWLGIACLWLLVVLILLLTGFRLFAVHPRRRGRYRGAAAIPDVAHTPAAAPNLVPLLPSCSTRSRLAVVGSCHETPRALHGPDPGRGGFRSVEKEFRDTENAARIR